MVVSAQSSSNDVPLSEAEVVNKTKDNFKTKIGNKYSATDVIKVWDCISKWIENNMNQNKGILIKGIGYFTFAQIEINVGKGYPHIERKPVFVVDEKLTRDFNLKRTRPYNTGNIHERYLNLSSVAQHFQLNIDMVTHCFKEVVTAFRKLLHEEKNCELPFSKIGRLHIKNKIVTMKFRQEFLERQNQNLKDQMKEEKTNYHCADYNPDWNVDQYENQKRPCSAIINRPVSSLSQYRPGTGYDGVFRDVDDKTDRPDSRLSAQSRPESRLSVQSRPGSRLSVRSRPDSRLSVQSRPGSRLSVQSRPCSRVSVQSRPGSRLSVCSRPDSRLSVQSRPGSRLSVCSRPDSRLSVRSRPDSRPGWSQSARHRPGSGYARPRSVSSALSRAGPASVSSTGPEAAIARPRSRSLGQPGCDRHGGPPPSPKTTCDDGLPTTAPGDVPSDDRAKPTAAGQTEGFCDQTTSKTKYHYDESLCCLCNIRKQHFEYNMKNHKANLCSTDDRGNFMKGDNLLNKLTNSLEIENERKNRTQAISNYNYVTAKELFNTVNKEKNKRRSERNVENCVLIKRSTIICDRSEKNKKLKQSLLDQIECNRIKTETDKNASLKNEKLLLEELLKNLHEERMKNIEAKARARENYLNILNEHMKNKIKISEEMKKKNDIITMPNTILGANEVQPQSCAKLNKFKNCELAQYQLNQHSARNLASREQKNKKIIYERNLLNQFKKEEEKLQKEMLQKKLTQKKYLTDDFNKWLETEHGKNERPVAAYPMTFPLKEIGIRCRLCRKNGLRFPIEKISKLPC